MNSFLAVVPFRIRIISMMLICGLASTNRWIRSGMTSMARIVNLYSSAISRRIVLQSSSIPSVNTLLLYLVHQTR